MEPPDLLSRPALASRVMLRSDPATGEPVLLYPEGVLVLNGTAHEIVMRCDGQTTVQALVDSLSLLYKADPEKLQGDALACLQSLSQRQLLRFLP
jgi:pyrroloquinoline quinone biosynthesis protein D